MGVTDVPLLVPQVWYDDPESLAAKYELAGRLGLRGVGMWNLDTLNYVSNDSEVTEQTQKMWQTLDAFLDTSPAPAPSAVAALPRQ